MRQTMLIAMFLACGGASLAQDRYYRPSKFEIFGGYAANKFFYTDSGGDSAANAASLFDFGWDRHGGIETSVARNLNRYLAVKADFSFYTSQPNGTTAQGLPVRVPQKAAYWMLGPEFKMRNRTRWTPYVHGLFGVTYSCANLIINLPDDPITTVQQSHSRTGFSMAFGGGVDFRMTGLVSVRWMTDYSATFLGNPDPEESGRQNIVRTALGLLFHLR
jgi:opacity protein-like surface antigen